MYDHTDVSADGRIFVDLIKNVLPCRALDDDELMSRAVNVQRWCQCRLVELGLLMLR